MMIKQLKKMIFGLDDDLIIQYRDRDGEENNLISIALELDHTDENQHEHYKIVIK